MAKHVINLTCRYCCVMLYCFWSRHLYIHVHELNVFVIFFYYLKASNENERTSKRT